jgi:hypothetical protein
VEMAFESETMRCQNCFEDGAEVDVYRRCVVGGQLWSARRADNGDDADYAIDGVLC